MYSPLHHDQSIRLRNQPHSTSSIELVNLYTSTYVRTSVLRATQAATAEMEADEWPWTGIGEGGSYGRLMGSVASGVQRLEGIN